MVGQEQLFLCPECQHHNHKLYVNVDKQVFNCFHCGFAGPVSKLKKYPEIYNQIEDRESLSVFNRLYETQSKIRQLNSELLKALKPFHALTEDDLEYDYLISRGWDADIIDCYANNILVSDNDRYINRVFITIEDENDNTVFYTGRSVDNNTMPKYMNSICDKSFIFKSKTPVDNFCSGDAFIGEGVFDMYKLPGGIALLGKTLVKAQHLPLFSFLRKKQNIYLCLDPGTIKESKILAKELDSWFPSKSIYILDWEKETKLDLGDLSKTFSRLDLISFIHNHSKLYTNKLF